MKHLIKTISIVILGFFVVFIIVIWRWQRPIFLFNESDIPRSLITANPVEFDRIYAISKFRSGAGHDYSHTWNGETCRSMKHYINMGRNIDPQTHIPIRSQPTISQPNIKIFAPFDGTIESIDSEQTPIGKQVHIRSRFYPNYFVRLFHIDLLPEFNKLGTPVSSGQQIGTIGPKDGTDVSIEANTLKGPVLLSLFEEMIDEAFLPYKAMGFQREDFIISRQFREVHPLKCSEEANSERFIRDQDYNEYNDFVFLKKDPFPETHPGLRR